MQRDGPINALGLGWRAAGGSGASIAPLLFSALQGVVLAMLTAFVAPTHDRFLGDAYASFPTVSGVSFIIPTTLRPRHCEILVLINLQAPPSIGVPRLRFP